MSDMMIVYTIAAFFIILGGALPYIDAERPSYDGTTVLDTSGASDALGAGFWEVLGSVLSMFVWTFGSVPFMLDLILFIPLRILFYLTIARNIWIGGGG